MSAETATLQGRRVTPEGLVARRRALGLTQRALGEMLGVPRNTVARWERGQLRVARPDWLALALGGFETKAASGLAPRGSGLPVELSSFVGREGEIVKCCALLSRARLITLTGSGGVGKSRLALKVASCAEASFPDGLYLVELASLKDPALVPRAVATALGVQERAGQSLTDVLIGALQPCRLLLILDNCEHLVEACCALADQLLRLAPRLCILATSREPFRVTGEIAWRVPSLKIPPDGAAFEDMAQSESVRLILERAQAAAPWFKLTEANAPALAQVCRQLDGIPLALELAAARMNALSVDQLATRLEHRFQVLTYNNRTAPSRQQTLRATVDWSYSLLKESERALFRRLSVFAGGWTVDAAEIVTDGGPLTPGDTLDLLERLIDKSLVVSEERYGTVRQVMLETLREYGQERLVEAGEADLVRRRHLNWTLELAERIDPSELRPRSVAVLEQEWDNLRVALKWALETHEAEVGLRLATAAGPLWNFRGHFDEGISWLKRLLGLPSAPNSGPMRARALKWMGILIYGLGDIAAAEAAIKEGYELDAGEAQERTPPVFVELLANIARASGDLEGAVPLYQEALRQYRELGLRFWQAVTLFYTASVLFEQGEYAQARAACDECLALGSGRDFTWATSRALIILAYLANHDGDHAVAEQLAQRALALQRAFDEPSGIGISLRVLGLIALAQGLIGRAWSCLAEAFDIADKEGDRMALARTLETTVGVLVSRAPLRAVQIAAAAAVLRAATHTAPWPSEKTRITRWLDTARRTLGTRAFDAAWVLGEALPAADIVATASRFAAETVGGLDASVAMATPEGPLTARQREIAVLIARGFSNRQIAEELVISPATARAHIEHVLDRLDLHSRAQIAAWAVEHGLSTQIRNAIR